MKKYINILLITLIWFIISFGACCIIDILFGDDINYQINILYGVVLSILGGFHMHNFYRKNEKV